jgi:hypothetical protein
MRQKVEAETHLGKRQIIKDLVHYNKEFELDA